MLAGCLSVAADRGFDEGACGERETNAIYRRLGWGGLGPKGQEPTTAGVMNWGGSERGQHILSLSASTTSARPQPPLLTLPPPQTRWLSAKRLGKCIPAAKGEALRVPLVRKEG